VMYDTASFGLFRQFAIALGWLIVLTLTIVVWIFIAIANRNPHGPIARLWLRLFP